MSLLTPEPGLLFWMTLSFGIVVLVLAKFAFPAILKMVDKRKHFIDESIVAARQAQEELAKVKETGKTLLDETRKEQKEILKQAAQMREEMIQEAREKAHNESEKMIASARMQIQLEKEEALKDIRNEISSLSLLLAEKIMREKLATAKEQTALIDRLLNEMEISKS